MNQFQAAGGMAFLIRELLDAGLLHEDVLHRRRAAGCARYRESPCWTDGALALARRRRAPAATRTCCARPPSPFSADGGLQAAAPATSAAR